MEQEISIRCINAAGDPIEKTIAASVIGALAVHTGPGIQTSDGAPSYCITHIASGARASPLYFETREAAQAVANVLLLLPVDWSAPRFDDPYVRQHLAIAIKSISALFDGYLVDHAIDKPAAGSA